MNHDVIQRSSFYRENIAEIALDICKTKIDIAKIIGKDVESIEEAYQDSINFIEQREYDQGFDKLEQAYLESDMLIKGMRLEISEIVDEDEDLYDVLLIFLIIALFIFVFLVILRKKSFD